MIVVVEVEVDEDEDEGVIDVSVEESCWTEGCRGRRVRFFVEILLA